MDRLYKYYYIRDLGCSRFWIYNQENDKTIYIQIEHGPLRYWNKKIHNPIRHALHYSIPKYRNLPEIKIGQLPGFTGYIGEKDLQKLYTASGNELPVQKNRI
ncbi:MAG: hypothetical protein J6I84_02525 [Bacilli bacterium]|nr:hypothetical protein [Bacilli bacterium]